MSLESDSYETCIPRLYNIGVRSYKILLRRSCFNLKSDMVFCVVYDFKITVALFFQLKIEFELVRMNGDQRVTTGGHDGEERAQQQPRNYRLLRRTDPARTESGTIHQPTDARNPGRKRENVERERERGGVRWERG